MWLISWLTTPSSSSRFMSWSSPVVAVIAALFGLTPVANALGDGSSITYTAGLGSPALIAIASTTLWSCWYWFGSAGRAHATARARRGSAVTACAAANNDNTAATAV